MLQKYICENCHTAHDERINFYFCNDCGKEICTNCKIYIKDRNYCKDCMDNRSILLTKKQALQVISCLENAIYQEDELMNKSQVSELYKNAEQLIYDMSNYYNILIDEVYIEPLTLKITNY